MAFAYGTQAQFTLTLASLASDTNMLVGRQTTPVSNLTTQAVDYQIGGVVMTGTAPTVNKSIELWVYGQLNDTPLYPDTISTADASRTLTSEFVKQAGLRRAATVYVDATSNRAYPFAPFTLASLFGIVPARFGLWLVHNTGVALHATEGNHGFWYRPITI